MKAQSSKVYLVFIVNSALALFQAQLGEFHDIIEINIILCLYNFTIQPIIFSFQVGRKFSLSLLNHWQNWDCLKCLVCSLGIKKSHTNDIYFVNNFLYTLCKSLLQLFVKKFQFFLISRIFGEKQCSAVVQRNSSSRWCFFC